MNMNETKILREKVKKIHFGVLVNRPIEGASLILVEEGETKRTSPVLKFMSYYSDRLWVVETKNSVYVLKGQEE